MAYCIPSDMLDLYGTRRIAQLTGDAQGQAVDATALQKAIDDYGDFIEQNVRAQHPDNPFDETHQFLNGLNVEGAFLRLKKSAPGGLDEAGLRAEARLDRILERIAGGTLPLLTDDDKAAPEEHEIALSEAFSGKVRLFGGHRENVVIA